MTALHELPAELSKRLSLGEHYQVRALCEQLRGEIERGELEPGRVMTYAELLQLPSAPQFSTVRCALWLLREEGLLETRRRLGTRVVVPGQEWSVPEEDRYMPLAIWVEKTLRQRLADRVYEPNTRIPRLVDLSQEFGVSIGTVRWGRAPLIGVGYLIVRNPNQRSTHGDPGTFVTDAVLRVPRAELVQLAAVPDLPPNGKYEALGASMTLIDWSRDSRCKVSYTVLYTRVRRYYWPIEAALKTPTS